MTSNRLSPLASASFSFSLHKYLTAWLVLLAAAGCFSQTAAAQATPVAHGGPTPHQVFDGSAKLVDHYNQAQMLRLVLGLQRPHADAEEEFLRELQDKKSPNFHKFLTPQQWNARFSPSKQDEQAVVDWAKSQGLTVTQRYANRLIVDVEAPAGIIEKAFNVTINRYQVDNRLAFSNDRDPEIPAHLTTILHSVGGLNSIRVLHPMSRSPEPPFRDYAPGPVAARGESGGHDATAKRPGEQAASHNGSLPPITNGNYDPPDMYSSEAYDTNALYAQGHCCNPFHVSGGTPRETSIAIATAGTQDTNDFIGFHNQYPFLAEHWFLINVDGTPACCDGEGTMDFEWATAMSNSFGSFTDTASVFMYDGVNTLLSTFTDSFNRILSDNSTRSMSSSWGCAEFDCYDNGTMDTQHGIFNSMSGQGWTITIASDDQGAVASCVTHLRVEYPASDPNVIAAGGTNLSLDSFSDFVSEVAWTGSTFSGACASNFGGSGGGCSAKYAAPGYQGTSLGCGNARAVPDLALNAIHFQNIFFNGSLQGSGGTSIVAPELGGFFANENAYLLALGNTCLPGTSSACAPMGGIFLDAIYKEGLNPGFAPHHPFYDITSGCNSNDVTIANGLTPFCAGTGFDEVTGWGSVNMLQLAWAVNWDHESDDGGPFVNIAGPTTNQWYNTDQIVSWNVGDSGGSGAPSGVAGFSQAWDFAPGDTFSEATPGCCNSFYNGPQFPNATAGCLEFAGGGSCAGGVSQGCHTAFVRAWDNMGLSSGDVTYGPLCYDTVPPVTTIHLTGTFNGSVFTTPVKVTLSAADPSPGSGVASTFVWIGSNPPHLYGGPFTISSTGGHLVNFHSNDVAGNVETTHTVQVRIEAPTTTSLTSSKNPSSFHQAVTFTATVAGSFGNTPIGVVGFKNGGVSMGSVALSGGVATLTVSTLSVGSHSITASYAGNGANLPSTSAALTQTVKKASTTTTLVSSVNPSSFHQSVTFIASVHRSFGGTATGTVTFKDGSTIIGTGLVNSTGVASFATTALSVAIHSITASYGGDGNFLGSVSAPLAQTVNMANSSTTLTSSLNPSTHGSAVTFTAKVTGAFGGSPAGTVTFKDGTTVIGTGVLNTTTHLATFTTSALAVGTHPITATYPGSGTFHHSVSAVLNQVVN
jgi:hypothetical protein